MITAPQNLNVEEDFERTNQHYMLPAPFFDILTGGKWHIYSSNMWLASNGLDIQNQEHQTKAQEAKLDLLASLLELKPGMRVLDVGCALGGALIYLGKKYHIKGTGLHLSKNQSEYANAWAKKEQVDCEFQVCHWDQFEPTHPFDVVMTDESIVHFCRLDEFFKKVYLWLHDDGIMLNKEVHCPHPMINLQSTSIGHAVNAIFGNTGYYRTLAEELQFAMDAGFAIDRVIEFDKKDYPMTLSSWENNIVQARQSVESLIGKEKYLEYRRYLRMARFPMLASMQLHVVTCRKFNQKKWEERVSLI